MTRSKSSPEKSPQAIRADLAARLRSRRVEIENAVFNRIQSLSDPVRDADPTYIVGLQRTVTEALSYGLEGIEKGRGSPLPIPPETARQARRAAQEGVRLDTVLRRYAAGNRTLEEFAISEADDIPSRLLCQILSDQGPHFDLMMESVAAEYRDEHEQAGRSSAQREGDRVIQLLEGEIAVPPIDLDYDFDVWHVGMILIGYGGEKTVRTLARRAGCRSLIVERDSDTVWAWLASTRTFDVVELARLLDEGTPGGTSVAIGDPRRGLKGWHQTFREAQAALQITLYRPQPLTKCRDVILESAVLRDPYLASSLIETYLAPLDEGRNDRGDVLRKTLRAYFGANRNIVSAASALNVARQTVERHLRRIEERLGQPIDICNAQLQVALSLEELVTPPDKTPWSKGNVGRSA
ncbi:MAG TPA: helix-turn-helix domain-containing protein [Solirubrobacterales bacterium]|nr:helix-turn-helix domain-containing protein [Solirubrobacterales bacterium]